MKIIIVSDSHGNVRNISRAIEDNPDANIILHAGDGALDVNGLFGAGKTFYRVRGNCDGDIPIEDDEVVEIDNVRILLTHGHRYKVSYFSEPIVEKAKELNCTAAVFGHTHKALIENVDNVLLINPGTCNKNRSRNGAVSYALLEIENSQIKSAKIINL